MRLLILAAVLGLWACEHAPAPPAGVPEYGYEVVHAYPHDPTAFTEGLFYLDGFLYESTGLERRSTIRKVRLETGEIVKSQPLPDQYFGEGMVNWKDHLIQLTYKTQVGFVYDLAGFACLRQFQYTGEGWALTQDGKRILMSDGTP
jgi:glutaminyl-peptide cyclotransferase